MFKAVISRDEGEPWGSTGMSTAKWLSVPVSLVRIRDLVATQPGIYFHPFITPDTPVGNDPYPHVIFWRGTFYLEDGHHRTVRAILAREQFIHARVLTVPDTAPDGVPAEKELTVEAPVDTIEA